MDQEALAVGTHRALIARLVGAQPAASPPATASSHVLVFPKTDVQAYGATAILYTTYEMDLLSDGKKTTQQGAATEVFVRQPAGRWVNTGWQLAPTSR